jgi:hypothetical protein
VAHFTTLTKKPLNRAVFSWIEMLPSLQKTPSDQTRIEKETCTELRGLYLSMNSTTSPWSRIELSLECVIATLLFTFALTILVPSVLAEFVNDVPSVCVDHGYLVITKEADGTQVVGRVGEHREPCN